MITFPFRVAGRPELRGVAGPIINVFAYALLAGPRIGPSEIVSLLGAGGMGEVYRARDTRLRRDVAIRILPDASAADPEHLSRFEREAQHLASLNHPNIGSAYGLEELAAGHRWTIGRGGRRETTTRSGCETRQPWARNLRDRRRRRDSR